MKKELTEIIRTWNKEAKDLGSLEGMFAGKFYFVSHEATFVNSEV